MQNKAKREAPTVIDVIRMPSHIEIKKSLYGATVCVGAVIAVSELSDERIVLCSHLGKISLHGEALRLTVYSGRTVQISGKITEVELGYSRA